MSATSTSRPLLLVVTVSVLAVATGCTPASAPRASTHEPSGSAPTLRSVTLVSATCRSVGATQIVVLDVETDVASGPLVGASPCGSIFDDTALLVEDARGARLAEIPHHATCSPYPDPIRVELADGARHSRVAFSAWDAPSFASGRVRLVGHLSMESAPAFSSNDVALTQQP